MNQLNPPTDRAMSTARAFFAAYSAHDIETMLQLCADNAYIRYVPMGKLGSGPVKTTGRKIWSGLISALPELTVTVKWSFGDGHHVGAEVLLADYQRGYELMHAFFLTLDDNAKITEVAAYWDNANLTFQASKVGVNAILQAISKLRRRS